MNAYKFNLVRFAIGSVLVTGMVLFLTWLLALFGGAAARVWAEMVGGTR